MTSGNKILIADDEPDILEIIEFNLKAQGYDVIRLKMAMKLLKKRKNYYPT